MRPLVLLCLGSASLLACGSTDLQPIEAQPGGNAGAAATGQGGAGLAPGGGAAGASKGGAGLTSGGGGAAAMASGGSAGAGASSGGSGGSGAMSSGGGAGSPSAGAAGSMSTIGPPSAKRGIAYGNNAAADLSALSPGVGWWYNWSPQPETTVGAGYASLGFEFVPMVWGGTFDLTTLATQVPADAKYLLTFNEPNFGSQSNLTAAQAAALWPEIQQFAQARGMKIVSPAVNYCGSPCNDTDPFDWLTNFFAACPDCQVDYIAMHWYACDKPAILSTLAKYEQDFGKPLWVTEFSCLDTASKVDDADELAYMQDAVAALEADPMVFRYAWFTGRSTASPPVSLLGASPGELTPLGAQYIALPH